MLECGDPQAPPLLLLHGSCSNSAFWFGEMAALAGSFRVFAADIIGEAGNSDESRYDPASDAYALWVGALLDQLSVRQAGLIGNSLGGWMALQFAAAFPERVTRLALLGASGIAPISPAFLAQSAEFAEQGKRPSFDAVLGENAIPQPVKEFLELILENFIPMTGALPVLTDGQMRKLAMPVLFIAGEQDVTMDTHAAAGRLLALAPQAQAHLIPNLRPCGDERHRHASAVLNGWGGAGNRIKREGIPSLLRSSQSARSICPAV